MEASARIVVALERLKGVYLETPEARLSLPEATSIAGLESHLCRQLLAALVDVRFLSRDAEGVYYRHPSQSSEELASA